MPKRERRRRLSTEVTVQRVHDGDMYVRVNSVGTGGIRPFVLVPGIGVSSTYFERLAPNLNEFGPVHAVDLPGFGGVPHPSKTLSISEYADLVGRVIDELSLDDPIVVGHSMGSQIVADLASRRPDLSTIVLIGPVIHSDERRVLTQARRFLQSSWHEPFTVKILALSAYIFCGFKWFSRVLPRMLAYPLEETAPLIQARTLIIRGEFDAVSPRAWVKRLGSLIGTVKLWEIPGAAHSVMYAHAAEVAKLCVDFARNEDAPDDTRLHIARDAEAEDLTRTLPEVAKAVSGRVVETVGILQDDDALIEQGKTTTAEALDEASNRAAD